MPKSLRIENIIGFLLFSSICFNFKLSETPPLFLSNILILLACTVMLYNVRKNIKKNLTRDILTVLIVFSIVSLYAILSIGNKNVVVVYLKLLLIIYTYYSFSRFFAYEYEKINNIFKWIIFGVAFSPFFQVNIASLSEINSHNRLEVDNLGNFNAYGFLISVSLILTIYLITQLKKKNTKIVYFIINLIPFFVLFYTFSRGALFSFLLGLIIFLSTSNKNARLIALSTLFITVLLVIFIFQKLDISTTLADRFFNTDGDDYDSGRMIIYGILLNNLTSSIIVFLFGFGLGAIDIRVFFESNIESAHSTYLDMFYSFGVIGLIFFLYFLYKNAKKALKLNKSLKKSLILALLGQVSLSFFYDSYWGATQIGWLFPFLFAFFTASFYNDKINKEKSVKSHIYARH